MNFLPLPHGHGSFLPTRPVDWTIEIELMAGGRLASNVRWRQAVKSEAEVEEAIHRVRNILAHLLIRFGESSLSGPSADSLTIPEVVLARVENEHRGDRNYFVSDIKRLASSLSPKMSLEQKDRQLLDSICTAADASASATFRKLW